MYKYVFSILHCPESLQALDGQLSQYAHLRSLDLSYNRLESLPSSLPRSLWDIRAAGNHLRSLDKNDTAYHWNLRVLDLSDNELERVVFINNTLPSLQALNLSHNRFWTVPTNMPHNLENIDLSHNYLTQILPGSLDRLPRLTHFYLHANRFSWLPEGIFDQLKVLEVMTLGDNPWACEEEENITRLLRWSEQTRATVFGCPCYTRPICGKIHSPTPGRDWHSALFTEPPLWVNSRGEGHGVLSPARIAEVTSSYQAKSALFETGVYQDKREVNESGDHMEFVWTASTSLDSVSTYTSTTTRPQSSTKKPKVANSKNNGQGLLTETPQTVTLTVLVMATALNTMWTTLTGHGIHYYPDDGRWMCDQEPPVSSSIFMSLSEL